MKLNDYIEQKMLERGNNRHTILIGDGGCSKSYQLIHLFNHYIHNKEIVPIYVPLCETKTIKGYSILSFIHREYIDDLQESFVSDYEKKLIVMFRRANQVKFLIMLDGYNELLESYSMQSVNNTIFNEIKQLSEIDNVYLVITSRYFLTGSLFSGFSLADVCNLTKQQIENFVPCTNNLDEQILDLLQSPFYLRKYIEFMEDFHNNLTSDLTITAGELLHEYLMKHIPLKFEREHTLDYKSQLLRKLKYCLEVLLPDFAFYMTWHKTHIISIEEMNDCLKRNKTKLYENWEIIDLLENYIVPANLMYSIDKPENKEYLFVHENYQDYFAALWWINSAKAKNFSEELLLFPLSIQMKKYIGDIIGENRFEKKQDCMSEPSPIECILRKNHGIFNRKAVQKFNRNCVEIMKISRHLSVIADYSELDLSLCRLNNVNCQNSNFQNCMVEKNTLIAENDNYASHSFLECVWTDGDILVKIYSLGRITATNILDGSQIYSLPEHMSIGNYCIYIDNERMIFDDYGDIRTYKTASGGLIDTRKNVPLCKDEEGVFKPLLRMMAEINKGIKNFTEKGKIYVTDGSYDKGVKFFDATNNMFIIANTIARKNHFVFYDIDFKRIGELNLQNISVTYNIYQNGWCIGKNYDDDVLCFTKFRKEPLSVLSEIKLKIDIDSIKFVYVSKEGDYAVVLNENLEIYKLDLTTGINSCFHIPRFKPHDCCWESVSADDDFLCFYYLGFDYENNFLNGICVFDYRNNTFRFKELYISPDNAYQVVIKNGDYGFVVVTPIETYLLNQSLIEISTLRHRTGITKLSVCENRFFCTTGAKSITFSCFSLDEKDKKSVDIKANMDSTFGANESTNIDYYIAAENYVIHKSGIKFQDSRLIRHVKSCLCDIIESTVSNQCAIIKYQNENSQIFAEINIIDKVSLEISKVFITQAMKNGNTVFNIFQRCNIKKHSLDCNKSPELLMDSFQLLNGIWYCFYDNLINTSLVKLNLEKSLASIIFELDERYETNYLSNGFIISAFHQSRYIEPYLDNEGNTVINIPTCSSNAVVDVYELKYGRHFRFDLSDITGITIKNIDYIAFSNDCEVLAVNEQNTNLLYFYKFEKIDGKANLRFIKRINVALSNFFECNFKGINVDEDTMQCLIDNGGYL